MGKNLLLSFAFFFFCSLSAQQVNWAINVSKGGGNVSLTTDNNSNVYQYQSFHSWNGSHIDEGSDITKYSPTGAKIFELHWSGRIYLTKMLNDGQGSFYFTGYFADTINANGMHLVSHGGYDIFLGKMDEDGQVKWAFGFGGKKDDKGMSLSFNQSMTALVLTGAVDSTVYLHDYEIVTTTKAIFLASFDFDAALLKYKTYSFFPKQYGSNVGLEIGANSSGYYMLADRMGQHWSNEPLPAGTEMEGRYLFKLDADFNIIWSQFIISSACYYGYSCNNMAISNDDAYVPRFCSGKYGGTGHLTRMNFSDGLANWSLQNEDGQYYDCHSFEGNVFFVGNEEVNGCPCPDNDPGNAKIKVIDKFNMETVLFKKYGFQFHNIVHAKNGSIYVFGHTGGEEPSLGGYSLTQGYFLFSLQDPSTGVKRVDSSERVLAMFPNPSQGELQLQSENPMDEVIIYDMNGAAVYQVTPHAKTLTIQDLPAGCFAVRVKIGEKTTTSKIIVSR